MKLLNGTHYDPSSAGSVATSSLLAMTAIDTTNLRLAVTAPGNGAVLVRSRIPVQGASTTPQILVGILDHTNGDAVKFRQAPIFFHGVNSTNNNSMFSNAMLISGLTGGTSYTFDLAYGVEFAVASSVLRWGGPNDTTANNAYGGVDYEIYDTPGLLSTVAYDPGTAVTVTASAATAITAFDTTNLRLPSFVCPSSGQVYVRLRAVVSGTTGTASNNLLGLLDGATVRFRGRGVGGFNETGSLLATDQFVHEAAGLVTGLTAGTTYTWDMAYGCEGAQTSALFKYGGPNDTTQDNAWGAFSADVWNVDDLPRAIGSVA